MLFFFIYLLGECGVSGAGRNATTRNKYESAKITCDL